MDTTIHDLKLLTIGYYIQGAIAGCYSLFILAYAGLIGTFIARLPVTAYQHGERAAIPPNMLSFLSVLLGAIAMLALVTTAVLFLGGYWIACRRNPIFIYVVAALSCVGIPYGTVLGIFTFIVMQRPAARELFGRRIARPPI